ncbi:hypothetical protein SIN8267_02821 [Sinobacterium norvegicum]|uniref:Sulfotransferase n=1 Tax=Sinobacterium norvegicum TaxID=1641715 RepID=A0ABM9AHI4_9GAMM|nr:sulfotransferase [Sinobacterium norvegicum]CAH0992688.1 hypothetical protein SIN8267_02821 [Sinobacterium norvegicum]
MSVDLSVNSVLEEAKDKTGLNDFGDQGFLTGLTVLMQTYDQNGLSDAGRLASRGRIVNLLAERLRIEDSFKKQPEIRDLKISKPMFLTGMPRTGTSALLNILASDPAARPLKLWEGYNPSPYPNLAEGETDPRYSIVKAAFEKASDLSKIHHTSADTPEECIHLFNHTFEDVQFGIEAFLEPYASFFKTVDRTKQYQYHGELLRMLQSRQQTDRWLLKSPYHLWSLDLMVKQHPDCSIIITHRDPREVVGSYCSMMAYLMPDSENADLNALGKGVLDYLVDQVNGSIEQRKNISDKRILDIQYRDFVNDNQSVIDSIYHHFELPYGKDVQQPIKQYIADHPQGKHGSHDYHLAQFGLDEATVLDRFERYTKAYNIAL